MWLFLDFLLWPGQEAWHCSCSLFWPALVQGLNSDPMGNSTRVEVIKAAVPHFLTVNLVVQSWQLLYPKCILYFWEINTAYLCNALQRGGIGLQVKVCSSQKPGAAPMTRKPRAVPSSLISRLCAILGQTVLAQRFLAWVVKGNFLEGHLETREQHYLFTQFMALNHDFAFWLISLIQETCIIPWWNLIKNNTWNMNSCHWQHHRMLTGTATTH